MEYLASAGVLIGIYVILATSYNLIIGYGGLITIAHPIFFALGAYTAALLGIDTALPAVVCIAGGHRRGGGRLGRAGGHVAARVRRLPADRQPRLPAWACCRLINNLEFTGGPAGLSNIPITLGGPERGWLYLVICGRAGRAGDLAGPPQHGRPVRPRDAGDARRRTGLRGARPQPVRHEDRDLRLWLRRRRASPAGSTPTTSSTSARSSSTSRSRRRS